jgi:hypothetical protein
MSILEINPYQTPHSDIVNGIDTSRPSVFRLTSKWGVIFSFPVQALLLFALFGADYLYDTEGMSASLHNAFTAIFISILAIVIAIYLSSISLTFKRPAKPIQIPFFAFIHSCCWYLLYKMGWFITLSLVYKRTILRDRVPILWLEMSLFNDWDIQTVSIDRVQYSSHGPEKWVYIVSFRRGSEHNYINLPIGLNGQPFHGVYQH